MAEGVSGGKSGVNDPAKVFVGNLTPDAVEVDLIELFSQVGQLISVEIIKDGAGQSRLHAFVKLVDEETAIRAIDILQDFKFMGRRLRLNRSFSRLAVPSDHQMAPEHNDWIQVHVRFTTREPEFPINEALLDALFSQFGTVADVAVKRNLCNANNMQMQRTGYGFVYYYDIAAATKAVHFMRRVYLDNIAFSCDFSQRSRGIAEAYSHDPAMFIEETLAIVGPLQLWRQLISTPLVIPGGEGLHYSPQEQQQQQQVASPPTPLALAASLLPSGSARVLSSTSPFALSSPPRPMLQLMMPSAPPGYPPMIQQPQQAPSPLAMNHVAPPPPQQHGSLTSSPGVGGYSPVYQYHQPQLQQPSPVGGFQQQQGGMLAYASPPPQQQPQPPQSYQYHQQFSFSHSNHSSPYVQQQAFINQQQQQQPVQQQQSAPQQQHQSLPYHQQQPQTQQPQFPYHQQQQRPQPKHERPPRYQQQQQQFQPAMDRGLAFNQQHHLQSPFQPHQQQQSYQGQQGGGGDGRPPRGYSPRNNHNNNTNNQRNESN